MRLSFFSAVVVSTVAIFQGSWALKIESSDLDLQNEMNQSNQFSLLGQTDSYDDFEDSMMFAQLQAEAGHSLVGNALQTLEIIKELQFGQTGCETEWNPLQALSEDLA